jgi:hypothetical protein
MRKLLFGAAAGLTALTVGAGIAAAQSDDTIVDDTVVDDSTDTTTDVPLDDTSSSGRPGCDDGGGDRPGPGEAPAPADGTTDDTATTS